MATADPQSDFRTALARGDLRFIGCTGYSLMVPGVVAGAGSRIVELKGVKTIQGTSDAGGTQEQERLQRLADRYAATYNTLLLAHLRQTVDPDVLRVRQETEAELRRMEQDSPTGDAAKAIRSGRFTVITTPVRETEYTTPGLTYEQAMDMDCRDLVFSPDLATKEQNGRMHKLLASYVAPYNRIIYRATTRMRNRRRRGAP